MQKIYIFLASILIASQSFGQSSAIQSSRGNAVEGKISLQQAIDVALQNNIQVKQNNLNADIGVNNLNQARFNRLPQVNGSFSQSISFGRTIDPFTNLYIEQQVGFQNFGLNAGVQIFGGYQLQNAIKQSEYNLQAAKMDVQTTKDNIALNVVLAYLAILNNEDLLAIAKNQIVLTKLQVERTEKLVNAGALPQTNLLDLKAQLANDEGSIVNAENALDLSKLSLLQLMNVNIMQDIQLDRITLATPGSDRYDATSQGIFDIALGFQPVIKAAELRVQSANMGIEIAKGALLPRLTFGGSLGTNYSSAAPNQRFIGDGTNSAVDIPSTKSFVLVNGAKQPVFTNTTIPGGSLQDFGYFNQLNFNLSRGLQLSLSVPIFNNYRAKTQVSNAVIQKKIQEYAVENTKLQLRQNIETAYNNMTAAAKRYAVTQRQVEALELAFKASESRFNVGALNSVDYNLAKTNLDRAKVNLVQNKYDYIFRTKILDYYQNKPLSF